MKRIFTKLLLLLCLTASSLNAQTTCGDPGGIIFTSQVMIDNFASDSSGCTVIKGPVTISGASIIDLDGLAEISLIEGNLNISNTSLTTLNGLDDLEEIKGSLTVSLNDDLLNLEGLGSLESLDGAFFLFLNDNLEDLAGVSNIQTFGTGIEISFNPSLTSLAGINYPENIPQLSLSFNDQITDLSPLLAIKKVEGFIEISDMLRLQNLNGLDSLKEIEGNFNIFNCDSLTSMEGVQKLHTIKENFRLRNNEGLQNLNGLDALQKVYKNVEIENNDSLKTLTGLEELDSIGVSFKVFENAHLLDVDGLTKLDWCGSLLIEDNDSLKNVNGFNNLTVLAGDLEIRNNSSLASLVGLTYMDASLMTDVTIRNCDLLSVCQTQAICNYLDINVGLGASIAFNASGCDSIPEVLDQCLLAPLAVEWLSFTGDLENRMVALEWTTASEVNNEGFEIQKSKDGRTWEKISFVQGRGTLDTPTSYSYIDRFPFIGENYYRLRQIDFNGDFDFSEVIVLKNESTAFEMEAYPNPAKSTTTLAVNNPLEQAVDLVLRDYLGRTIWVKQLEGQTLWSEQINFDTRGIYFLTAQIGDQRINKKLVITGSR